MPSDYIPSTDAGFRTWAENFSLNINNNPALYMMTAAEAASIAGVVTEFAGKLAIADNELTRTKQTIADKDDARSVAQSLCRQYAMLIKDNAGITDGDKLSIGVRPVNPNREPIECPQTSPLLNILGNIPGVQELRYADSTTPDSARKPFGASELQLFLAVSDTEPATLADAKFYGKFSRNPIEVNFTTAEDRKLATYFARWASVRGEVGPWSLPVTMTIAA